ncbi:Ribosomal protein S18 acetylase RimI [Pseudomonas asplenii]|uniref:Ribosomal protein S18 acetylase RimI n=2 Tax=Pseudomonas asplenii TaxID=53407 RepID=A0A1H6LXQ5_9PSED|nr:Ribosomal protein S18 acetylase RimI [Pseudomonas fuscovaginae]
MLTTKLFECRERKMIATMVRPVIRYDYLSVLNVDFMFIASHLSAVSHLYPGFKEWLYFKFKPEFLKGSRDILVAYDGNNIAGLSLLKFSDLEHKVCTFYVVPAYRGLSIGNELMDRSLSFLCNQNVTISVSQEREVELYPVLKNSGFRLDRKIEGTYRPGVFESFYSI